MPQAVAAAKKSVALDDSLGEAHSSLAAVELFYKWNFQEAERESARAVELDPRRGESHHLRAYVLTAVNRLDEALQEEHTAAELEPLARPWALGAAMIRSERFREASEELRVRSESQPRDANALYFVARAYDYLGMEKKCMAAWEKLNLLSDDPEDREAAQKAIRRGGLRGLTEWHLINRKMAAAREYVSPLDFAGLHAQLRHRDEALLYLEKAYRRKEPWLVFLQHEPDFDFLHAEPRYREIVEKMGLPPAR